MSRFKATLSYDGTPFHGWQVQPGLPTVQQALATSIHHVTGETVLPQGSGRTDTGVHALGQVASFDLASPIPAENLQRALNRILPPAIRILALSHAAPDFHARHSAVRKTYEYRILPHTAGRETICSPMLAPYVWAFPRTLDLHLLNQAAIQVIGQHDFTSFAASEPDQGSRQRVVPDCSSPACAAKTRNPTPNTRTIHASGWTLDPGLPGGPEPLVRFRVTGSGFLHHMVRNLVGTFVEVGSGRIPPERLPSILAARYRAAAGPTAPAHGLFLAEVEY